MTTILDTGIKNVKNVKNFEFGNNCWAGVKLDIDDLKSKNIGQKSIVFLDENFFINNKNAKSLSALFDVSVLVSTKNEPSTEYIDELIRDYNSDSGYCLVCGVGGGITMDTAKAFSNLLTNGGRAEQYQGWDLLKRPGVFKIGIPTISGTGAESTRTCVMTNNKTKLKLGMNSDFTVFDKIYLDPTLTKTVPRNQYFYTAMDAYIHCMEALSGNYRNPIGDSLSREAMMLCKEVFLGEDDMMSDDNRSKLMVASYLGGVAIAASYVGVVHPLSAGLSVMFGTHHCVGNCIVMRSMKTYYPKYFGEFWEMVERSGVDVPKLTINTEDAGLMAKLREYSIMHEKPLFNALGDDFRDCLNQGEINKLFGMM